MIRLGEKRTLVVDFKPKHKYIKSEEFKKYYVTGAIGGFRNPYDFRLTFFNVDSNEFLIKAQDIKSETKLDKNDLMKKLSQREMPNIQQCELIMSERTVRELYNFIGKELEIFDEMKEKPNS